MHITQRSAARRTSPRRPFPFRPFRPAPSAPPCRFCPAPPRPAPLLPPCTPWHLALAVGVSIALRPLVRRRAEPLVPVRPIRPHDGVGVVGEEGTSPNPTHVIVTCRLTHDALAPRSCPSRSCNCTSPPVPILPAPQNTTITGRPPAPTLCVGCYDGPSRMPKQRDGGPVGAVVLRRHY